MKLMLDARKSIQRRIRAIENVAAIGTATIPTEQVVFEGGAK